MYLVRYAAAYGGAGSLGWIPIHVCSCSSTTVNRLGLVREVNECIQACGAAAAIIIRPSIDMVDHNFAHSSCPTPPLPHADMVQRLHAGCGVVRTNTVLPWQRLESLSHMTRLVVRYAAIC